MEIGLHGLCSYCILGLLEQGNFVTFDCERQNLQDQYIRVKTAQLIISGVVDWAKEVRHQIGKHDRASLQILSENIVSIIEKAKKSDLKTYLQSLNDKLLKVYKRSSIENARQSKMVTSLQQIDLVSTFNYPNHDDKGFSNPQLMYLTIQTPNRGFRKRWRLIG